MVDQAMFSLNPRVEASHNQQGSSDPVQRRYPHLHHDDQPLSDPRYKPALFFPSFFLSTRGHRALCQMIKLPYYRVDTLRRDIISPTSQVAFFSSTQGCVCGGRTWV